MSPIDKAMVGSYDNALEDAIKLADAIRDALLERGQSVEAEGADTVCRALIDMREELFNFAIRGGPE